MKWLIGLLLSLSCQLCMAEQFNIYVTYEDSELKGYIQQFNGFLKSNGIFEKYDIQPFAEHYPLHTTLYLTHFESYSIPNVINVIQKVASNWYQFNITTTNLYITDNNYVMLDVAYQKRTSGLNPVLQIYSDKMVMALYQMRDTLAPIPDWAKGYPSKHRAYQRYGSPNVFFEFSPHFTLMAKQFKNKQTAQAFHDEVQALIKQYQQSYPEKHITLTATNIGLGYVNYYGQVTREITNFDLRK